MNVPLSFAADIQPVFYFGLNKDKPLPEDLTTEQIQRYFEYSLKQEPDNLSRHLQRIRFALRRCDNSQLFSALCDLFIILGNLGQALRQRVVKWCQSRLNEQQSQLLLKHLQNNHLGKNSASLPEQCLFKQQRIDFIAFDQHAGRQVADIEDIFQTIDSYIEHSQFDSAINCMTQYLEQDPDNEQLTLKLIHLYQALNNNAEFAQAYERFANNLLTSRHWDEARAYFLNH